MVPMGGRGGSTKIGPQFFSVFETIVLTQLMMRGYINLYLALVQPPSNTMAAVDDGTTVPSAHRSAPYSVNVDGSTLPHD